MEVAIERLHSRRHDRRESGTAPPSVCHQQRGSTLSAAVRGAAQGGSDNIYAITLSTGSEQALIASPAFQGPPMDPDWSPDGSAIVYSEDRTPNLQLLWELQLMNSAGGWIRSLTSGGGLYPQWSPNRVTLLLRTSANWD